MEKTLIDYSAMTSRGSLEEAELGKAYEWANYLNREGEKDPRKIVELLDFIDTLPERNQQEITHYLCESLDERFDED
jgi:hypothetical protein